MTKSEPQYACNCVVSPRPKDTYREIKIAGRKRIVCGWCRCMNVKPAQVEQNGKVRKKGKQ